MRTPTKALLASTALLSLSALSASAALTTTFVGDGTGQVINNGGGSYTLTDDTAAGDIWDGGDTFTYLHEENKINQSFTATVRVVGQTEDAAGRWGKAGISVRSDLTNTAAHAMTQVAAGIGSQVNAPSVGDHSPVPQRLAGRFTAGTLGAGTVFERPILEGGGAELPNNLFPEGQDVNETWLSLSWDAATNEFQAGSAPDVGGVPGTYSFSDSFTDIIGDGTGWYVGMSYSAHDSLTLLASGLEGQHGITFDNFSINVVPEPSTSILGLLALGFFGLRRRR